MLDPSERSCCSDWMAWRVQYTALQPPMFGWWRHCPFCGENWKQADHVKARRS